MHFPELKLKGACREKGGNKSNEPQKCSGVNVVVVNSALEVETLSNSAHKDQLHFTGIGWISK